MIIIHSDNGITQKILIEWEKEFQIEVYHSMKAFLDQNRKEINQDSYIRDATISVITELINARDCEPEDHLLRTQKYMEILANCLSANRHDYIQDKDISMIVQASKLHDIGKIGIPDSILLKPSKLTQIEYEIMQSHTQLGMNAILKAIIKLQSDIDFNINPRSKFFLQFLKTTGEIILSHHERWDGEGYPQKLMNTEIPVPARMMALVDVFDALTTPRIYKNVWNLQDAIQYIYLQRGKQFDPVVVDAFLDTVDQFKAVLISKND